MSKLSEKPFSIPRQLCTRDLILKVLDRQAMPISTSELVKQLRKLGPNPTPDGLKQNLQELLRLGHIRREHDPDTGAHWVRVPDNVIPSERPKASTTRIREFCMDTLKHGPATAAMLAEGAKRAGIIEFSENPHRAALTVGNCLQSVCKSGELEKTDIKTVTGTVSQYRLPGAQPAIELKPIKPKSTKPAEPISELQKAILEFLSSNPPATANEMAPILISAGILKAGAQSARTVGSACHGLEKRGSLVRCGNTQPVIWSLPGQPAPIRSAAPINPNIDAACATIAASLRDLADQVEHLRTQEAA